MTVQPGSVHAFESVDLYSMVSGYLKTPERGHRLARQEGQVLAEIDVPREARPSRRPTALLEQARAQALQAEARVKIGGGRAGDRRGRRWSRPSPTSIGSSPIRKLAESQFARIRDLLERNAVGPKLVDEQQRDLESAARRRADRPAGASGRPRPAWRGRSPRWTRPGPTWSRPGPRSTWPRRGWTRPG